MRETEEIYIPTDFKQDLRRQFLNRAASRNDSKLANFFAHWKLSFLAVGTLALIAVTFISLAGNLGRDLTTPQETKEVDSINLEKGLVFTEETVKESELEVIDTKVKVRKPAASFAPPAESDAGDLIEEDARVFLPQHGPPSAYEIEFDPAIDAAEQILIEARYILALFEEYQGQGTNFAFEVVLDNERIIVRMNHEDYEGLAHHEAFSYARSVSQ